MRENIIPNVKTELLWWAFLRKNKVVNSFFVIFPSKYPQELYDAKIANNNEQIGSENSEKALLVYKHTFLIDAYNIT